MEKINNELTKKILKGLSKQFFGVEEGYKSLLETENKTIVGAINEIYDEYIEIVNSTLLGISIVGPSSVTGSAEYSIESNPSTASKGVTWSISSGSSYASINNNGTLVVSTSAYNDSVTIKAVSTKDQSITATKNVTVSYPISLSISGDSSMSKTGTLSCDVFPSKAASSNSIVWSIISGSDYATIDQTGKITIESGTEEETITVKASIGDAYDTFDVVVSNIASAISDNCIFYADRTYSGSSSYSETLPSSVSSANTSAVGTDYDKNVAWRLVGTTITETQNSGIDQLNNTIGMQNSGLTEWTMLLYVNVSGCSSTGMHVDENGSTSQFPQGITGPLSVVNYAWGSAKISFNLFGSYVEGSQWNPGDNSSMRYAIKRNGSSVSYSKDGTTWTSITPSSWNSSSTAYFSVGGRSGGTSKANGSRIHCEIYDSSEIEQTTIDNFFSMNFN